MVTKYERLNEMRPGVIELQTKIAVNEKDRMAGQLLDFLCEKLLSKDATNGDAFDVLEAALWWLNLWTAEGKAIKIMKSVQHSYATDGGYCARCDMKSVYDGCCINCGFPPTTANN